MNNNNKNGKVITLGIILISCLILVICFSLIMNKSTKPKEAKTLEKLMENVSVREVPESERVKGNVNVTDTSLFDELPEINKYPLVVEGNGKVDIEIFTSGEKASDGTDSWLIDVANSFNSSKYKLNDGKTVSMSVRSVTSGMGAEYIASGKYLPDLYTPSSELMGAYCESLGGKLTLAEKRTVGNTAGILVKKGSKYKDLKSVLDKVSDGSFNLGYTNPQTSATGLNLLLQILKDNGGVTDDNAVAYFKKFNSNIPFVAYTTQQMRDSAQNGTLDGMVTEYQAYINDKNLTSLYEFIPFGVRHDNPLYIVKDSQKTADEKEAIQMISDYMLSDEMQEIATKDGFNENDSYKSKLDVSSAEISEALKTYKSTKDAGKDIIAVFVADCSGSMDGEPLQQLKESLSNGMQYINENNKIGLVSYSTDVTIELPIAPFDFTQKAYFQGAVNGLSAGGGTSSYEAICVALGMVNKAKEAEPNAKCMIFLLSDGYANGKYYISDIRDAVEKASIPIYTIGYTDSADMNSMNALSNICEAASINADEDDIMYKIKSLFNSQL